MMQMARNWKGPVAFDGRQGKETGEALQAAVVHGELPRPIPKRRYREHMPGKPAVRWLRLWLPSSANWRPYKAAPQSTWT